MTVPVHGLPPLLYVGLEVAAVPPALKGSRWHVIEAVSSEGGTGELVRLSGVRSIGAAEELTGKTLLAAVGDLPSDLALHDVDALLDRDVQDASGTKLGTISEVMRGPANDVWVVDGAAFGEVLLPVIPEVVVSLPADGPIVVAVPDGLLPASASSDTAPTPDSSTERF